jgi:hypothetical protein
MNESSRAAAALALCLFCSVGCRRPPGALATAGACRPACARVAALQLATDKKGKAITLHEMAEAVESAEDQAVRETRRIKAELVDGDAAWDERAIGKLAPDIQKARRAQHAWDLKQLTAARELELGRLQESVVEARQTHARATSEAAEWETNNSARLIDVCLNACLKKEAVYAVCLSAAQAVEDIQVCEHR